VRPRTPKENRVEVLPPILAGLRRAHPELVLSNRVDDLLHRSADIAVRMLRPVQAPLVARRVGGIEIGLHATRSLDTWIAMHEDLRDSPRCAATFAALADGVAAYVARARRKART